MKKIFSFVAEANGLWGRVFAVAATVYGPDGLEIARFVGRCPIEGKVDSWVQDNVLPKIAGLPETHANYDALLVDFAMFFSSHKDGADVVVHMGYIVEAGLLRDMHSWGLMGDFAGPYPLLDVSGNLQQVGEDPTSVDGYLAKYGLTVGEEFVGGTHSPLYDSAVAATVYRHLQGRIVK